MAFNNKSKHKQTNEGRTDLALDNGILEEVVQQQILQTRVLVKSLLDVTQETTERERETLNPISLYNHSKNKNRYASDGPLYVCTLYLRMIQPPLHMSAMPP